VHDKADTVGVVVEEDVIQNKEQTCRIMQTDQTVRMTALDAVPLGHKIAINDIKTGDTVLKYDLSESQPTKGNISGGLTTIEEKAFGNLQKIGRKAKFIDVLKPAEAPAKGPGLYYMDTSSAAAACVTLQAAAGFVVHLFPTGQGNVIGNPIEPVIKLTANPKTARTMSEHIDLRRLRHPAA
jgi:altronate dehydratase